MGRQVRTNKPDPVSSILSRGVGQDLIKVLLKAAGRRPETSFPMKQFLSNPILSIQIYLYFKCFQGHGFISNGTNVGIFVSVLLVRLPPLYRETHLDSQISPSPCCLFVIPAVEARGGGDAGVRESRARHERPAESGSIRRIQQDGHNCEVNCPLGSAERSVNPTCLTRIFAA